MESSYESFLHVWNLILWIISGLLFLAGIVLLVYYSAKVGGIKDYKSKYDYIRDYEVKFIFYALIFMSVAVALFINTLGTETIKQSLVWFLVRLFVAVCAGTLVIYIGHLMLKYSYPTKLHKKLKKWRYKPRINVKTGNPMQLLSEEEEDVHLDAGMQAEENVFSVDYDVWVEEATGDVHIEKYPGHLQAYQCNTCGFQTMKQIREEIILAPSQETEGELERYYECSYCGARRHKILRVAKLSQDEAHYQLPSEIHFKEERRIRSVSVEIYTGDGKKQSFDFPNTDQASRFLKEFELDEDNS